MKKGYVINEIHNEYCGSRYAIGIECDYEIKDDKINFTEKPRIFFRCIPGVFIYVNNAKILHKPGKDLKRFKDHLKKLQNDEEYNKRICKYFMELSKNDYPEDVYEGLYYEFNEN